MNDKTRVRHHLAVVGARMGHHFGPPCHQAGAYTASCSRCQGEWHGPGSLIEKTPCIPSHFAKQANLQCSVPGCPAKATHVVSWFYRKNRRAEVVSSCEKHGRGLLDQAYANSNFRTPAMTQISPQRAKMLDTHATKEAPVTQKVAHDSGDGETIYHCPFCGSGQVTARSDRTIECDFCHTCFTVQVQPELPAFPQTINGMPVAVPGMPGQIGDDGSMMGDDMGSGVPGDIDAEGPGDDTDMMEPGDLADDDQGDDSTAPGAEDADEGDEDDEPPAGGPGFSGKPSATNQPPWLKGKSGYRTAAGAELNDDQYVRHLALQHADDAAVALSAVRERAGA